MPTTPESMDDYPSDALLKVSEVAARLRVSNMTIYRLVRAGTLPAIRIENSVRIPITGLHAYLRSIGLTTQRSLPDPDSMRPDSS